MTIRDAISQVVNRVDLSEIDMYQVMTEIMTGAATPAQIGAFLTGLRMKGETVDEISGAVRVMREKAKMVDTGVDMASGGTVVDTCGTGGDCSGTFNVSTTAAFVVAGCGFTVAKHGNRSVSSACGSADVLEAAGVKLDLTPEQVGACIRRTGIGFLFAPSLHGAMKYAIGPRREIGIRTIFNILGPLTNPAGADRQVLGVFRQDLVAVLAKVLQSLGCKRGYVVHGADGMDELTLTGPTSVAEIDGSELKQYEVTPEQYGFSRCPLADLQGGDATANAAIVRAILAGEPGPKRDVVLLNSGFALAAAGVAATPADGVVKAAHAIDCGAGLAKLEALVALTNKA